MSTPGSENLHNVSTPGSENLHNVSTPVVRKIPSGKWFSLRETALIIGVSRESVRKWKKQGLFVPAMKDHDGRLFYSREQVEQLASVYRKDWNDTYKLLDGAVDKPGNGIIGVPSVLKGLARWVLHKKKVPMSVRVKNNHVHLVKINIAKGGDFLSHEQAVNAFMTHVDEVDGIGFVLDKEVAPIVCIDLDGLDNPFKEKILAELNDTYVEFSPSGEGLHVWFVDHDLDGLSGRRIKNIEIYCDKRYMTFTGHHLDGCAAELSTHDGYMRSLIFELFDKGADVDSYEKLLEQADFNVEPKIDDEQLISIIKNSNDCSIKELLFEGNVARYRSPSEADWHLALKLCWWTAGNLGQIKRLFDTSPLAQRDKWLERQDDYAVRTIVRAHSVWDHKSFKLNSKPVKPISRELVLDGFLFHLLVPRGYSVNDRGIFKLGGDDDDNVDRCICCDVILPTRMFSNVDSYNVSLELSFKRKGHWSRFVVANEIISNTKNIVSLSTLGLDITSINARAMVSFFRAFKTVNADRIKVVDAFSQTGWRDNTHFIYPSDSDEFILDVGRDINLWQLFKPQGDRDAWLKVYNKFKDCKFFRLAVAASLAAPMLKLLRLRNMTLQFWSQSGAGKTAILKFADSVYKCPVPLLKFNSTKAFLEARSVALCDFPLCVDELKTADTDRKFKSSADVFAHLIESGASKGRATKHVQQRDVKHFRTIAIITGEHPLTEFASEMGIKRRTLEIYCNEIFPKSDAADSVPRQIHLFSESNYGLVGLDWIKVLENADNHALILEKFNQFRSTVKGAKPDAFDDHCDLLAACATADFFFNKFIAEPDIVPNSEMLFDTANQFAVERQEKDSVRAIKFIADWCAQNAGMFVINGDKSTERAVKFGWIVDKGSDQEAFAIIPTVLRNALKDAGFNPNKVLAECADDGFIVTQQQKDRNKAYYSITQRIKNEGTQRVVKVLKSTLTQIAVQPDE